MVKRRRNGAYKSRGIRRQSGRYKKRAFRPGYDRTSGYYGRYKRTGAGELKFFDTDVNDASVSNAMTINNLTIVPEGNGESDRVGRKITIKKIHIRGTVTLLSGTDMALCSTNVLCMLVQDTQTNGAAFAATDLLDTDNFKSFRNLANSQRFKVLYKKVYSLKVSGAAPTGAALAHGEDIRYINVNKSVNIPIEYDNSATTGAVTTVRSNNLYWVTQATEASAGITAGARIRYQD